MNPKKKELTADLREIHEVFRTMNHNDYWVFGGVLLGHYRDNDFISWDKDMDIGSKYPTALPKDFTEPQESKWLLRWLEPFVDAGFSVEETKPTSFWGHLFALRKRVTTDLFFHEEYNGDLCYGLNNLYYAFPKEYFTNMAKMDIVGKEFNIPTPVKEHFYIRYGTNWGIPNAPIIERRKLLTKEQFYLLFDKKCSWRTEPNKRLWGGRDLIQEMIYYYNSVVYVAGCWDLFHIGHLRRILESQKFGHKLIVGVVTDEYLKYYKTKEPIISYAMRKEIIEGITGVWKAVPYDAQKSVDVYDEEGITTLVVGDDYPDTPEHKLAMDEAKKRGIKVISLPRTGGISSSEIKEKCKG